MTLRLPAALDQWWGLRGASLGMERWESDVKIRQCLSRERRACLCESSGHRTWAEKIFG